MENLTELVVGLNPTHPTFSHKNPEIHSLSKHITATRHKRPGELQSLSHPEGVFVEITMDFVTDLPTLTRDDSAALSSGILKEYLDERLGKDWKYQLTSPAELRFIFVPKKDGTLPPTTCGRACSAATSPDNRYPCWPQQGIKPTHQLDAAIKPRGCTSLHP